MKRKEADDVEQQSTSGPAESPPQHEHNGDKDDKDFPGIGSFHKSLPHDEFGNVYPSAFAEFVLETTKDHTNADFEAVDRGPFAPPITGVAQLTSPHSGLACDRLTHEPRYYAMPPAPKVRSHTTAAEMNELYWMALLRDVSLDEFDSNISTAMAAADVETAFSDADVTDDSGRDPLKLRPGIDLPGHPGGRAPVTARSLFRLGLPGTDAGPMVSQFFMRPIAYGAQEIVSKVLPYAERLNHLTDFDSWLTAQQTGKDSDDQPYGRANEANDSFFDTGAGPRYVSTMRDLARFVNKDALHQAYFNAALLMSNWGVEWTPGNPYADSTKREAGFGLLGGPHLLALVSEIATRALKIVWFQKWQVHLRLRPEAYGGLVHVQNIGNANGDKQAYGLSEKLLRWQGAKLSKQLLTKDRSYLLPMAFTPGSPTHPAYGAGHATVAGACVTVLKAYFKCLENGAPLPLSRFKERDESHLYFGERDKPVQVWVGRKGGPRVVRTAAEDPTVPDMTLEGELNKLAHNVAMGRSMGGVHWRTDNARSLVLGEAIAASILFDVCKDSKVSPKFVFRTFARANDGNPKLVEVSDAGISVGGMSLKDPHLAISDLMNP